MTVYLFLVDYNDAEGTRWLAIIAANNDDHAKKLLRGHHATHHRASPVSYQFLRVRPDSPVPAIGFALPDIEPGVMLVRKLG